MRTPTFLQFALRRVETGEVTVRGITGYGNILCFVPGIHNAEKGWFTPYAAQDVTRAAVALFEQHGCVAQKQEPREVTAPYGPLTNIPHYVPRLHVMNETEDAVGDLLFNFKGEPIGIVRDDGTIVKFIG